MPSVRIIRGLGAARGLRAQPALCACKSCCDTLCVCRGDGTGVPNPSVLDLRMIVLGDWRGVPGPSVLGLCTDTLGLCLGLCPGSLSGQWLPSESNLCSSSWRNLLFAFDSPSCCRRLHSSALSEKVCLSTFWHWSCSLCWMRAVAGQNSSGVHPQFQQCSPVRDFQRLWRNTDCWDEDVLLF